MIKSIPKLPPPLFFLSLFFFLFLLSNSLSKNSQLSHLISQLPPSSPSSAAFRTKYTNLLLNKLHSIGLLPASTTPLSAVAKLSASKFARRRLAVVMARTGMVENIQAGIKFVEQGHVRVGTDVSLRVFFPLSCFFLLFLSLFFFVILFPRHSSLFISSPSYSSLILQFR